MSITGKPVSIRMWFGFPEIILLAIEGSELYSKRDEVLSLAYCLDFRADDKLSNVHEINLFLELKNFHIFEMVLKNLKEKCQTLPINLITSVSNLALLGLRSSDLSSSTKIFSLDEFSLIIRKKFNTRLEQIVFPSQITNTESFFQSFGLTDKQIKILILIFNGFTNSEISKRLVLSEKGIESSIHQISIKLDVDILNRDIFNRRVLLIRKYALLMEII